MAKLNKSLISGSFLLLVTFNIFNILNFFYNFAMVRFLTIAEYGILSSLISMVLIFAIFSESIQTVISRYTTKEKDLSKIKNIIIRSSKRGILFAAFLFLIYLIIIYPLSNLLSIPYGLMALAGMAIFTSFLIPITRGVLQGKKRFSSLGNNMIFEGAIKLCLSIILVIIGLKVYGALLGIVISSLAAFALSFISIRDIISKKEKLAQTLEIYAYTKPVFIITLVIILFLSLDIILVRRFFSPDLVGAYAVSSTIAKIIFIGTQPISRAMFPISTETKRKVASKRVLSNSLYLLAGLIILSLLIVYFLPSFLINIYSGKIITDSISILFYLSLAMGLLSITNLLLLYKLSLGRTNKAWFLLSFIIIEVILLSIFNKSLVQFSIALVVSSAIFLIGSILLLRNENINNNTRP